MLVTAELDLIEVENQIARELNIPVSDIELREDHIAEM